MAGKRRPNSRELPQSGPLPSGWRAVRPFTYVPQSGGGFQIAAALLAAHEAKCITDGAHSNLGERNIWLDGKRGALRIVEARVRQGWQAVRERAQRAQRAALEDSYTLTMNPETDFPLAVDVVTYVMLLDATLDAAVALATSVERAVGVQPRTPERTLRAIPGVNAQEQQVVASARDAFAHDAAPWLSVVVMKDSTAAPDLAILTADEQDFETGTGYVLLSVVLRYAAALEAHLAQLESLIAARLYGVSPEYPSDGAHRRGKTVPRGR